MSCVGWRRNKTLAVGWVLLFRPRGKRHATEQRVQVTVCCTGLGGGRGRDGHMFLGDGKSQAPRCRRAHLFDAPASASAVLQISTRILGYNCYRYRSGISPRIWRNRTGTLAHGLLDVILGRLGRRWYAPLP
jgi:hypothetical protein